MPSDYQTVLAIRGPRQSGKGSCLIAGGIAIALQNPDRCVLYASPSSIQTKEAQARHGAAAPQNFIWSYVLLRVGIRFEQYVGDLKPTLILLDEAQDMGFPGASQFAHRLSKKFKTSVWFTENECDYREEA